MPDVTVSRRVLLDAETDQALGEIRAVRARMPGHARAFAGETADGIAAELLEQFPFTFPLGRVVIAVAQSLKAVIDASAEAGRPVPAGTLALITALAGEQLDREERSRG